MYFFREMEVPGNTPALQYVQLLVIRKEMLMIFLHSIHFPG